MTRQLTRLWRLIRSFAGDDAYECYKAHHATCHRDQPLLDARAFYLERQREKWGGVNRCC